MMAKDVQKTEKIKPRKKTGNAFIDEHFIIAKPGKPDGKSTAKNLSTSIRLSYPVYNSNWTKGVVTVNGKPFVFEIKHFATGSEFGINNGCISKMYISSDSKVLVNYDRGWDIRPNGEPYLMAAYNAILDRFNNGIKPIDKDRARYQGIL